MNNESELIQVLNKYPEMDLGQPMTFGDIRQRLQVFINELIENDFPKLTSILYRVDIDEVNLKSLLNKRAGEDAASIIAELIMERELQKIETRKQYRNG